jgi:hypothetical protein
MMLDEADMRILARLGAALLVEWDAVPENARGAIFATASTLHAERDATRIKGEIAHLLTSTKIGNLGIMGERWPHE